MVIGKYYLLYDWVFYVRREVTLGLGYDCPVRGYDVKIISETFYNAFLIRKSDVLRIISQSIMLRFIQVLCSIMCNTANALYFRPRNLVYLDPFLS